jgi:hypothetical protein
VVILLERFYTYMISLPLLRRYIIPPPFWNFLRALEGDKKGQPDPIALGGSYIKSE